MYCVCVCCVCVWRVCIDLVVAVVFFGSQGNPAAAKPKPAAQAKPRQPAAAMFDDDDYLTELPPVAEKEKPKVQMVCVYVLERVGVHATVTRVCSTQKSALYFCTATFFALLYTCFLFFCSFR
jgi:hypothetical protein